MYSRPPTLDGYCYSGEESRQARDKGELRAIRMELSLACNLRCTYCCNRSGEALPGEIRYEEMTDTINQAKELKARSVVIIGGGEPTIHPRFRELVAYVDSLKMVPVIFTNAQTITPDLARFLYAQNVSVIIKLDSLDEEVQDTMVGVRGAYKLIMQGLINLQDAGYSSPNKLGASFVVNKQNADGIPDVWRFCRNKGIFPNLEMMIPNGIAEPGLMLTQQEWRTLKAGLLKIDRDAYEYDWSPHTPLAGAGCFQVMHNLYITVSGDVRPCSSIHHADPEANIRRRNLREIMELPFFRIARFIDQNLGGKCGSCTDHAECVGCRGLAYATARGQGMEPLQALCAPDPSCSK